MTAWPDRRILDVARERAQAGLPVGTAGARTVAGMTT